MEFLQKIGEFFLLLTRGIERFITRLFGSSNERRVRQIGFVREKDGSSRIVPGSILDKITQFEPAMQQLSDDELRMSTAKFRARLDQGEPLEQILPEVFAAVRESGRRYLRMRHFDVQLVGGYVLHKGMIAEMVTGEGKTLVATLPAYLNGLVGKVHVVTVNDYLARRDMEWMGPLYLGLGMSVGAIQSNMDPQERVTAYACDITYGTNNEFGFDYLRDNMKTSKEQQVQGRLDFALVDEIDNILIDEARTPLIISGFAHDDVSKYAEANKVAIQLQRDVHFQVKEKEHTCHLTDEGIRHAEHLAGVESFYTVGNMHWPHLIDNALKAHHLYKRDVHYVVEKNGDVVIIDEHTGRKMVGRQWSDGLHQAVEAKEGVRIKEETQTLATITLQNFFKLYKKLAGMTGTAMTEADEFLKIYGLDVVNIPTNRPMKRINNPDVIYRYGREKWEAVVEEIKKVHEAGRPVLVGTVSIEKSELLSSMLKRYGIEHSLLNAKYHEREAEIIAQAGRMGAVTISTNMAGRGTDIILGGNPEYVAWHELSKSYASRLDVPKIVWDEMTAKIAREEGMADEGRKVAELGGLHVVGTERHDSRRIDLQLRGRAGRQGDPGSSRFFLSLEDDLMRIFMGEWVKDLLTRLGMQEGEAIESRMVTNRIEAAQKKVEERHFDMRKHLLEYDEVMDKQRKEIYSFRQRILDGANCRDVIIDYIHEQVDRMAHHFLDPMFAWDTITAWAGQKLHVEFEPKDIRGMSEEQVRDFILGEARRQAEDLIEEKLEENLPGADDESNWNWEALTRWVNSTFNLTMRGTELHKIGRDELRVFLYQKACDAIEKYDLSMLSTFLSPEFNAIAFADWLNRQYTIKIEHQELMGIEADFLVPKVQEQVDHFYRDKEARFPVTVGIPQFFVQDQPDAVRIEPEGLLTWANNRFGMQVEMNDLLGRNYGELEELLVGGSRRFLAGGDAINQLDEMLDQAYGSRKGSDSKRDRVQHSDRLQSIVDWSNREFSSDFETDDFDMLTRQEAKQLILKAYDRRFRPELHHVERVLILDFLDTAWKEHLYFMDHLRAGVGLVGYAQKDPKVEYSREGMQAFREMKQRIGEQVTANVFRIEHTIAPEYAHSLWNITSATHAEAETVTAGVPAGVAAGEPAAAMSSRSGGGPVAAQSAPAIDPIRNRGPRVGRNDPCPCGSGKKYKKCCGVGM